jgi:tetratricopeptide (TPR) repeat protein
MDLIKNVTLFGFPVMSTKIDKKAYNKKSIISTIEKNFKLNKKRNLWDKTSVLHHAYGDFSNPKYHKVNFSILLPLYQKALVAMFDKMTLRGTFHFDFSIVNYTCLSNSQYMHAHLHMGADFTAVHYIQFDKKHHTPTIFENTLPHVEYIDTLRPDLLKILNEHPLNSWAYKGMSRNVEEDDFYFYPAFLKHKIDPQTSKKKNRITIVLNITLKRNRSAQEYTKINNLFLENKFDSVIDQSKKMIQKYPKEISFYDLLGSTYRAMNQLDESIKFYEKAYKINSKIPTIVINLVGAYQIVGKFELAKNYLEIFLKENPNHVLAHKLLSSIKFYKKDDKHQTKMLLTLNKSSLNNADKATLLFSLAKSYDDQKNYKKSYEFFKKANDLQRKSIENYSIEEEINLFKKIKDIFKDTNFNNYSKNIYNEKKLIFIVGLPRSGTTLTHQILSSHSKVYGAGELPFMSQLIMKNINNSKFMDLLKDVSNRHKYKIRDEYLNRLNFFNNETKIIIDKTPLNFQFLGFIRIIFPNAKIIHCTRSLKDTSISLYKNIFDESNLGWTYNENDILKFISAYLDLMKFWKNKMPNFIYECNYENLVNNQEKESRNIFKFCDLAWESNALKFFLTKTPIKSASIHEARKPIYKSSLNSYQKYSKYCLDFFKKLDKLTY